jgi:dTDP-4-amino-4,6-dideoxy-D-galactose acyltransferase
MAANPELCSILEWDSVFFGVTIARVNATRLEVDTAAQIMDWCQENDVRCLYFLADSNHIESLRLAEANGFYLTDVRVTFDHSLRGFENQSMPGANVRPALAEDLPTLRAMTVSSYRDSRFYYDGHFPQERCDRLYETWIEKSLSGYAQAVLVMGEPGSPGGFVTCHTDILEAKGQIGLVGVSTNSRGRGVGQALVMESLRWFTANGMKSVQVVTQGRNIPAQRLYQKCGFLTKEVRFWYHCWFGEK